MNAFSSVTNRVEYPDVLPFVSSWACDWDNCTPENRCDNCKRRQHAAEILKHHDRGMRNCSMYCTSASPCESCSQVARFLEYLFLERQTLTPLLIALKRLSKAFPDEFREILVAPVMDIITTAIEEQP